MKWFGSAMVRKGSWRPLLLALLIMVMLALAWLPNGELAPGQRSNKPFLYVTYSIATDLAQQAQLNEAELEDILFDLQQRIESRHEWRPLQQAEPHGWTLAVTVQVEQQLELIGELQAPSENLSSTTQSQQRFKVQGKVETYAALPEQYVKVLIQLIENGHQAQSGL